MSNATAIFSEEVQTLVTKDEVAAVLLDAWEHEMGVPVKSDLLNVFAVMAESVMELIDSASLDMLK